MGVSTHPPDVVGNGLGLDVEGLPVLEGGDVDDPVLIVVVLDVDDYTLSPVEESGDYDLGEDVAVQGDP